MPLLIAVDLGSHAAKVTTFRSAGRKAELEDRFSYPVPQAGGVPTLEARLAALQAAGEGVQGDFEVGITVFDHSDQLTYLDLNPQLLLDFAP